MDANTNDSITVNLNTRFSLKKGAKKDIISIQSQKRHTLVFRWGVDDIAGLPQNFFRVFSGHVIFTKGSPAKILGLSEINCGSLLIKIILILKIKWKYGPTLTLLIQFPYSKILKLCF